MVFEHYIDAITYDNMSFAVLCLYIIQTVLINRDPNPGLLDISAISSHPAHMRENKKYKKRLHQIMPEVKLIIYLYKDPTNTSSE